jgi:hypothetical protein
VRRHAVILAALTVALAAHLTSDARAAWIEPVSISQLDVSAREPQIAVDASGDATAVWTSGAVGARSIRSAFRPAGGSWETPFNRMTSTSDCHDPMLAVNPSGAAVVIADCEKPTVTIRAAYRPGASWSASTEIPGSASGKGARAAIDDEGNAVAVWTGTSSTVQTAYRPTAGAWTAKGAIGTVGKVTFDPNVAISPNGVALAAWREERKNYAGDPVIELMISTQVDGGSWTLPSRLSDNFGPTSSTPISSGEPQLEINANGERMTAWGSLLPQEAMFERTSGGELSGWAEPIRAITEAPSHVELPQIAIDGQGRGIATWRSFTSAEGFRIKASTTSTRAGSWAGPTILADLAAGISVGAEPDVAADPAGDATAVWNAGSTARASSRPAGAAFVPATTISNAAHTLAPGVPMVTMDESGDAIAAWSANDMTSTHIAVAVNDVTPPNLGLGHTSNVPVGSPVDMQATVSDLWSGVAGVAWAFGDGATATGTHVTHAYASSGGKTVTVSATDGVGNTVTQTFEVTIVPGPAGGPGGSGGAGSGTKEKLRLDVTVPKQRWKKIKRARAISMLCGLNLAGTCSVTATVTRQVAKRLGLKLAKGAKTAIVGSGAIVVRGGDEPGTLKAKLTGKARRAIDAATKAVPIVLAVSGSAAGSEPEILSRTLRIKRP